MSVYYYPPPLYPPNTPAHYTYLTSTRDATRPQEAEAYSPIMKQHPSLRPLQEPLSPYNHPAISYYVTSPPLYPQLKVELLKRPYGDAVFAALKRTVDEEEAVVVASAAAASAAGREEALGGSVGGGGGVRVGSLTGDKVWSRASGSRGSGDGGSGSGSEEDEEEESRLEFERVEAAARRTALWAVARGFRKELPADVRVRVEGGRLRETQEERDR